MQCLLRSADKLCSAACGWLILSRTLKSSFDFADTKLAESFSVGALFNFDFFSATHLRVSHLATTHI